MEGFFKYFIDDDFAALSAADRPEFVGAIEEERRLVLEKISQQNLASARKCATM